MILDSLLQFSSGQDLSQVVGDYASSNVIDLGETSGVPSSANGGGARDMGVGDKPAMKLMVEVIEVFASAGAATLQIAFQGAPDDGSGGIGSYTTYALSPVIALASLTAGARLWDIDWPRPAPASPLPRFVRLLYSIAGATTTTGTVTAYAVLDRIDQPSQAAGYLGGYPAGITVAN